MITRNDAQYPLHHVTYPASKFEVATPNRLGGETVTRKYIFIIFDYDLGVMVTRNVAQYPLTASNLGLLLQKEQNVKGGEGPSEKQAVGINNGTR